MRDSSPGSSSTGSSCRKIYVLDASGIFAGIPLMATGDYRTTSLVIGEVRDENSRRVLERALEIGRLKVVDPGEKYLEEAVRLASSIGVAPVLSEADLSVIALALELAGKGCEVVVVSDDYAVQNTALQAGIRFMPVRTRGIAEARRYDVFCPVCGYRASRPGERVCPRCGAPLVKRVKPSRGER